MVACAAITEEGEIFFYFNRTLFQDILILKQCPSLSALFRDIVLKQCPLVIAACAVLTERGEFFFYFNRSLFQGFTVLKQCPSVSAACYFNRTLFQDLN